MEPHLYEIIMIFRFGRIPAILQCLRSVSPYSLEPRGHFCRRLDLYLGAPSGPGYVDEAWYEGGHTLWGLVPTCQRLEILLARVIYRKPGSTSEGYPHLTHSALWKTISRFCAGTLRRLELYGFTIRMDRVELMLRYMANLEVCHIDHCYALQLVDFGKLHVTGDWRRDVYDEEKTLIKQYPGKGRTLILSDALPRGPCLWFDDRIMTEFEVAKRDASWPPFEGNSPYVLAKLHTLYLDEFCERFFEFSFPSLKSLTLKCIFNDRIIFGTPQGTSSYYSGPGYEIHGLDFSPYDHEWDESLAPSVPISPSQFTHYPEPKPQSTIFGAFPSTITHLSMRRPGISLAGVVSFFPNLTHLTWDVDFTTTNSVTFSVPHRALQHIMLVLGKRIAMYDMTELMRLVQAVSDGWLVEMRELVIGIKDERPTSLPW
ncbi:hypothetical protein H0H92_009688, partial [Tricholoma furcatifolium]